MLSNKANHLYKMQLFLSSYQIFYQDCYKSFPWQLISSGIALMVNHRWSLYADVVFLCWAIKIQTSPISNQQNIFSQLLSTPKKKKKIWIIWHVCVFICINVRLPIQQIGDLFMGFKAANKYMFCFGNCMSSL